MTTLSKTLFKTLFKTVFLIFGFASLSCSTSSNSKVAEKSQKNSEIILEKTNFDIKGMSVVATIDTLDGRAIDTLKSSNSTWIAYSPYAYCDSKNPTVIFNEGGQWFGESLNGTKACIKQYKKAGFQIMLKPQLWMGWNSFTGIFTLESEMKWIIWENSYKKYILAFAKIAEEEKLPLFCIGTELALTTNARLSFWKKLIIDVKEIYKGKLTYASNWDEYTRFPLWKELDYIGVDAYFPLSKHQKPTDDDLHIGWVPHLNTMQKLHDSVQKQIIFTEFGYRNCDYTALEPWTENNQTLNDENQVRAFAILFKNMNSKKWFAGGFIWKWYLDSYHHNNKKPDFSIQKSKALEYISAVYGN